jgi:hypothetical protein
MNSDMVAMSAGTASSHEQCCGLRGTRLLIIFM